jgi:hypothetical protein
MAAADDVAAQRAGDDGRERRCGLIVVDSDGLIEPEAE